MFASCLPEILATASQCVIECDPRLVPLFARSFPLADVVATASLDRGRRGAMVVDVQIAAGSLPRFLRRNLGAFPRRQRYLAACPWRRARWRERYAQLGNGLKVGICLARRRHGLHEAPPVDRARAMEADLRRPGRAFCEPAIRRLLGRDWRRPRSRSASPSITGPMPIR